MVSLPMLSSYQQPSRIMLDPPLRMIGGNECLDAAECHKKKLWLQTWHADTIRHVFILERTT